MFKHIRVLLLVTLVSVALSGCANFIHVLGGTWSCRSCGDMPERITFSWENEDLYMRYGSDSSFEKVTVSVEENVKRNDELDKEDDYYAELRASIGNVLVQQKDDVGSWHVIEISVDDRDPVEYSTPFGLSYLVSYTLNKILSFGALVFYLAAIAFSFAVR